MEASAVVVGVDGSVRGDMAAAWAAREAARRGLLLRVVYVSGEPEPEPEPEPEADPGRLWPPRPYCPATRIAARLTDEHPRLRAEVVVPRGAAVPSLLAHADRADMLVVGARGTGGSAGLPVGSVARGAVERARCPVVLVPMAPVDSGVDRRPAKVTLGLGGGELPASAVEFAFEAAVCRGAFLHAVHACAPPDGPAGPAEWAARVEEEQRVLSCHLRPWREKYSQVRVLEHVVLQRPAVALPQAAQFTELTVVGHRGAVLGPVVLSLLRHSRSPVAVVPG
ncbi:universal stress protein [Streptomyces flavofungini]|uniref:universal stress protein n=1 Tax=Streptomyces flavofungini TaxID=68200 RepID=UPI0025AEED55|nr:universal stress protein [Streptomyces flavofungini]WJV44739.1 universal stress protein [Streptomyces flavofungini]